MLTEPTTQAAVPRPRLHFTPPQAWLNDPHGICWAAGQYHLFYQYNPAGRTWGPVVHWGHATSADLVHWHHQRIALSPHSEEGGCWSGSALVENDRPTLFYTSVVAEDLGHGRVALAFPDDALRSWQSTPADIVIDGPPEELHAYAFRDPCLIRWEDGWRMIVGVGVSGGTGLAVQYSSTDARTWTYDGVICSRPAAEREGVWTGGLWECPQLFRVGDDWALVISVWDDDKLYYVAAAVGSYDGRTFTPERWSRLTHDDISYAMTSFSDTAGRPCVMFWLREEANHDPGSRDWAGALSLPMVVEVGPDRSLRLSPHPDVDALRGVVNQRVDDGHRCLDLEAPADQIWTVRLSSDGTDLFTANHDGTDTLTVSRPGRDATAVPVNAPTVRIVIDTGIVEVFGGSGSAAFRVRETDDAVLSVDGSASAAVHQLAAAF